MKRKLALSFVLVTWIASVLIFGATAILPIAKAAESSYGNRNTNGNSNGDTDKETDKSPSEADAEKKATPNNPDPDKDNDNELQRTTGRNNTTSTANIPTTVTQRTIPEAG